MTAGWMFEGAVQSLIVTLERRSGLLATVLVVPAGLWLGWKLWRKVRFESMSRLPHITADELLAAMSTEPRPLLLDLRGATMIAATGPVPGARVAEHDRLREAVAGWPREQPIVTLCACPKDAGAIKAARRLLSDGYRSVRPLQGGYEAWIAVAGNR